MVVWAKGGKVIEVPFVVGVGMGCVSWSPFAIGAEMIYCTKQVLEAISQLERE